MTGALAVEDLHELDREGQQAVLRRIAALGDHVSVTITSREPLDPGSRMLLRGPVFERGPADLALSPHATVTVLSEEFGVTDPEVPGQVQALTGGWPALVQIAGDALSRGRVHNLAVDLTRPGSVTARWLASDVLPGLPRQAYQLLGAVAGLDPLTQELVDHLATNVTEAGLDADAFGWLCDVGLLIAHTRLTLLGRDGYSLIPVLRPVLRPVLGGGPPRDKGSALLASAAHWYEHNGFAFAGARTFLGAGEDDRTIALIARRGPEMVDHGDASSLVELIDNAWPGGVPASLQGAYAEALHMSGDSYSALRAYGPLATEAERGEWEPGLAYRVAAVHHTQGSLPEALRTLDLVRRDTVGDDPESVLWRATRVNVLSMLGADEEAEALAAEALARAERTGDPRSLVAAHQAAAKTSSGSRKAAHLEQALAAAERAGDVVSAARILVNQSFVMLATARFTEAVRVGRKAVQATEVARPTGALIGALHNLGEALTHVGEYDEARWHLERAVSISRRVGPNRTAAGLCGIGDVHRILGNVERARTSYHEAVTLARTSNELQVLVPALSGLARLVATSQPKEALVLAEEAHRLAPPSMAAFATTALGWACLALGEPGRAAAWADESVETARQWGALDLLAEGLELAGQSAAETSTARAALNEAAAIWRPGGAEPAVLRVDVLLGRLDGADSTARSKARQATRRLHRLGVTRIHGLEFVEEETTKAVSIQVLGGFRVTVQGEPVAFTAWRSRQARTLVKILAGRRGRPSTRAYLCDLLWPDDELTKTGHRLSVLLTTVRGVLDPERAWPVEHYISSDLTGVWLDLRHVWLDAESLIVDATHASALLAGGDTERAREILTEVDARYGGDAFEDEPYEEWAEGLREEARSAWVRSLRHLATLATREGRTSDVCAILVRLLGADPYDDRVHRGLVTALVRSGRHGEARRAFDNWTGAMAAINAPRPDAAVLTAQPAHGSTARGSS